MNGSPKEDNIGINSEQHHGDHKTAHETSAVKSRLGRKFTQRGKLHPELLVMDSEMTSLLHCQMQNMNPIELWI